MTTTENHSTATCANCGEEYDPAANFADWDDQPCSCPAGGGAPHAPARPVDTAIHNAFAEALVQLDEPSDTTYEALLPLNGRAASDGEDLVLDLLASLQQVLRTEFRRWCDANGIEGTSWLS